MEGKMERRKRKVKADGWVKWIAMERKCGWRREI